MDDPMQTLITALQGQGHSQEQIANECEAVTWQAYETFYEQVRTVLTEEDNKAIDEIDDDQAAEEEMKRRYTLRTGNDPQVVMTSLVKQYAQQVINEYSQSSSSDQPVS